MRAVDEGAVPASTPATSRLFVLPVAARRWVSTDNRFELEQIRAQLAAAEDRIRTIQEAWEKSEESLARILDQVYQHCYHAHEGP